ncbi:hypothetical protein SPBR_06247 [Sporothrix brasiliensis 5110]|uniref:Uncharacterized protein n=1 Tax=Sporothrix brasiliensis 5110 TaxID=1398154 RepID=A0A0C2F5T3_9PEZI|nr:uncharacterized protein SPBR_06247 [Sporothrix brasiliensis 5110]KIH94264.1 hypothetical protein SPBR_06247 [Sporothrix brasiliensis 5110]
MFATRVLRQAAAHAERAPLIKFIGKRSVPASPSDSLPADFASGTHTSFSSYRDHAQQFGPLRKTVRNAGDRGIGGTSGRELGTVQAGKGEFFDRNDLPARFRRSPISVAEIEAVETGGAAFFA